MKPTDIMTFGKNKGHLLSTIYKFEPSYLEWLILNTEQIAIDIEAFEKLPNPTPISTGYVSGSEEYRRVMNKGDIIEVILQTDIFNERASVNMVKEHFERNPNDCKEIHFEFSSEAKKINEKKMASIK